MSNIEKLFTRQWLDAEIEAGYVRLREHPSDPDLVIANYTESAQHDGLVQEALDYLAQGGSLAARGFMRPEGVIVHHSASGQVYKALLESDHLAKSQLEAA